MTDFSSNPADVLREMLKDPNVRQWLWETKNIPVDAEIDGAALNDMWEYCNEIVISMDPLNDPSTS
jgi:hypothetical protein